VLILLIRGSYIGLRNGLINEIFKIFGIIVALFISIRYYSNVAQFLATQAFFSKLSAPLNEGLSFTILVLAIVLIFKLGWFIGQFIIHLEVAGPLERIGGLFCGFIRGGIIASLILFVLNLLPLNYLNKSINENSWSGSRLIKVGPTVYNTIIKFVVKE
jgi:uncharacterized membrane protein required for colicin V production